MPEPVRADSPRLPGPSVERGAVASGELFVTEWSFPPSEELDGHATPPVDPAPSATAYLGAE